MKIIVMSDNHGDPQTIEYVNGMNGDGHFHCGDSELAYTDPVFQTMFQVRGNCDIDRSFPEEVETKVKGKKIWMVHGHRHQVKSSLMPLYYGAKERAADIVLFGHSHLYGAEMKDGILFVNPGSTNLPRGGNEATFAVIEWADTINVTFKGMNGEIVDRTRFEVK